MIGNSTALNKHFKIWGVPVIRIQDTRTSPRHSGRSKSQIRLSTLTFKSSFIVIEIFITFSFSNRNFHFHFQQIRLTFIMMSFIIRVQIFCFFVLKPFKWFKILSSTFANNWRDKYADLLTFITQNKLVWYTNWVNTDYVPLALLYYITYDVVRHDWKADRNLCDIFKINTFRTSFHFGWSLLNLKVEFLISCR